MVFQKTIHYLKNMYTSEELWANKSSNDAPEMS